MKTHQSLESALRREAAKAGDVPIPAGLHERIMAAVDAQKAPAETAILRPVWRLVCAAAALVLLVGAGVLVAYRSDFRRQDMAHQDSADRFAVSRQLAGLDLSEEHVEWLTGNWLAQPLAQEMSGLKQELVAWAEPLWDSLPSVSDESEQL